MVDQVLDLSFGKCDLHLSWCSLLLIFVMWFIEHHFVIPLVLFSHILMEFSCSIESMIIRCLMESLIKDFLIWKAVFLFLTVSNRFAPACNRLHLWKFQQNCISYRVQSICTPCAIDLHSGRMQFLLCFGLILNLFLFQLFSFELNFGMRF